MRDIRAISVADDVVFKVLTHADENSHFPLCDDGGDIIVHVVGVSFVSWWLNQRFVPKFDDEFTQAEREHAAAVFAALHKQGVEVAYVNPESQP